MSKGLAWQIPRAQRPGVWVAWATRLDPQALPCSGGPIPWPCSSPLGLCDQTLPLIICTTAWLLQDGNFSCPTPHPGMGVLPSDFTQMFGRSDPSVAKPGAVCLDAQVSPESCHLPQLPPISCTTPVSLWKCGFS